MKIALITGASSGIGKAFAQELDTYNLDELWCISRSILPLQELAHTLTTPCKIIPLDLGLSSSIAELQKMLATANPQIQFTINNAGFGLNGDFVGLDRESQMSMVDLNCKGVVGVSTIVLPYMHKGSTIIHTSSIAGFGPLGSFALYGASKAFATSFSVALGSELKSKGIQVTTLAPGSVATDFQSKSRAGSERKKKFFSKRAPAKKVVLQGLRDAKKGKTFSIYGRSSRLIAFVAPLLPQYFSARLAYTTIYPKPKEPTA